MIKPTMQFFGYVDFAASRLGEIRLPIEQVVEFLLGNNSRLLAVSEIAAMNALVDLK